MPTIIQPGTLVECVACGWREYTYASSNLDEYYCEACGSTMPHRLIVKSPRKGGEKMSAKRVFIATAVAFATAVAIKAIRRA